MDIKSEGPAFLRSPLTMLDKVLHPKQFIFGALYLTCSLYHAILDAIFIIVHFSTKGKLGMRLKWSKYTEKMPENQPEVLCLCW